MKWEVVRVGLRCAYGCQIHKNDLAAIGRRGFVLCKTHAHTYKFAPPRGLKKREQAEQLKQANANDGKLRQMPSGD